MSGKSNEQSTKWDRHVRTLTTGVKRTHVHTNTRGARQPNREHHCNQQD